MERDENGVRYVNCEPTAYGYAMINRALMEGAIHKQPRVVIIDVRGGVAEIAEKPDDVEVLIRDWDDCEAGSTADYCNETDDQDDDPQCVCGTYRSEHRAMGCGNFQTAKQWESEKEFIGSLDDDQYERIYGDGS